MVEPEVSIPLTIADKLSGELNRPRDIVLMGFGVGWSWSAIKLTMGPMTAPQVVEFD
jgi:3-oxoacyl-[acyl-carrier-protein] synthase III